MELLQLHSKQDKDALQAEAVQAKEELSKYVHPLKPFKTPFTQDDSPHNLSPPPHYVQSFFYSFIQLVSK